MSRKSAREYAYKLVFEYLFSREDTSPTLDIFFEDATLSSEDKQYIESVTEGVKLQYEGLMAMIGRYTKGFTTDRMFKPDIAALLLCTYELKYMQDIPPSVSIYECIELVKSYSTEKSSSYVNGILASIVKEINGEITIDGKTD